MPDSEYEYERTRAFYLAEGFEPLFESRTLWGEENVALILVSSLAPTAEIRTPRSAFPDRRNELVTLRHADDAVVVELWLLGTHTGHLGGLEPTGRAFRTRMLRSSSSTTRASSASASTSIPRASSDSSRCIQLDPPC